MKARGTRVEHKVARRYREDGWVVIRSAGSFGFADLVCLKEGFTSLFIEVKSDVRGPFAHFGPVKRKTLLQAAAQAGAVPLLAYWPPHSTLTILTSNEWPGGKNVDKGNESVS